MNSEKRNSVDRRSFLRTAGGGSAAAAAALVSPLAGTEAQAYNPGGDETKARYQEKAADVQAFYRTNGYETLKK